MDMRIPWSLLAWKSSAIEENKSAWNLGWKAYSIPPTAKCSLCTLKYWTTLTTLGIVNILLLTGRNQNPIDNQQSHTFKDCWRACEHPRKNERFLTTNIILLYKHVNDNHLYYWLITLNKPLPLPTTWTSLNRSITGPSKVCALVTTKYSTGVHRLDNSMTTQSYNWTKLCESKKGCGPFQCPERKFGICMLKGKAQW